MNTLRSDEGKLIANLTPNLANLALSRGKGKWVVKHFKNSSSGNCFVFSEDGVISLGGLKLYIWEGYYLEGNVV